MNSLRDRRLTQVAPFIWPQIPESALPCLSDFKRQSLLGPFTGSWSVWKITIYYPQQAKSEKSYVLIRLILRVKYRGLGLGETPLELRGLRLFHEGEGYGSLFCLFVWVRSVLNEGLSTPGLASKMLPLRPALSLISEFQTCRMLLALPIHLVHPGINHSFFFLPVLASVLSRVPGDLFQNPESPWDPEIHAPMPCVPLCEEFLFPAHP